MGWASGSRLAADVWAIVRDLIPERERMKAAKRVIAAFEKRDCDTIDEAEQLCADAGRTPKFYDDEGEA